MKELDRKLANPSKTPYSRGGEIFMAESKGDNMSKQEPNPRSQQSKAVSPERQQEVAKMWQKVLAKSGGSLESSPTEMQGVLKQWIKEGKAPNISGGADIVDIANLSNPDAIRLADQINLLEGAFLNERVLEDFYREASGLTPSGDRQTLLDSLRVAREQLRDAENTRMIQAEERRFGFYLQPTDLAQLRGDAVAWLDSQFDVLYRFAQEGQELTSPIVNNMQTVVSEAVRYLQTYNPDILEEFQRLFTIRFNLMQNRTAIGYRSIDNIKQAAHTLGVHGLLYALSFENGRVGAMFNRMHEMLEDERLSSANFHITPHTAYQLQEKLIQEQLELAEKGVGLFAAPTGEVTEEIREKRERDIRRAVRTAYDVFASSQRMAVLVARGKRLEGNEAYFSDPASGPLNVYNIEDLLYEKFDLYNIHDQEFVERMKLEIADDHLKGKQINPATLTKDEKLDLGKRLFRDLFAVPDFFSSGWRIEGVLDALNDRFGIENAGDLALFLRLKLNPDKKSVGIGKEEYDRVVQDLVKDLIEKDKTKSKQEYIELIGKDSKAYRKYIWKKISLYRPEEIIRLFRERAGSEIDQLFQQESFRRSGVNNYDEFKSKYGKVLRVIREKELQKAIPAQTDMSNLSEEQTNIINLALGNGEGQNVMSMFRGMQGYIDQNGLIDSLLEDTRFTDIYARTILLDDAILERLEVAKNDFVPLSKRYAADQGGDALVRSWNDHENAIKASQALIHFIKSEDPEERIKASLEFAERAGDYNGQSQRGKAVRFTAGTFLKLSKKDYFWDMVGLETGLLRTPVADIQRIYGPQAKSMSRDELRDKLDKIRLVLVTELGKKFRNLTNEEKKNNKDYLTARQDVEKFYHDLEGLLEVKAMDKTKLAASRLFLFLILALFGEAYQVGKTAIENKAS